MCAGRHQPGGIVHSLFRRRVGHERHVRHDECPLIAIFHALGVIDHVFHGHRQGGIVALKHHAQESPTNNTSTFAALAKWERWRRRRSGR